MTPTPKLRGFVLGMLGLLGVSIGLVPSRQPVGRPPVSITVGNDTRLYASRGITHVRSPDKLALDLVIRDAPPASSRPLTVFVAIFDRNIALPQRFKPGRFLQASSAPLRRTAGEPATRLFRQHRAVEIPPGQYLYYVFLCDPAGDCPTSDLPVDLPGSLNLPGRPIAGFMGTATVG